MKVLNIVKGAGALGIISLGAVASAFWGIREGENRKLLEKVQNLEKTAEETKKNPSKEPKVEITVK